MEKWPAASDWQWARMALSTAFLAESVAGATPGPCGRTATLWRRWHEPMALARLGLL